MTPGEIARGSLGSLLDRSPAAPEVRAAVRARLQGTCAIEADHVGLEDVEDLLRPGGARASFRLAAGNQALAEAIAAGLADVRLGAVATLVRQDGRGVEVHASVGTTRATLRAAAAVLALPLPILRSLPLEPALPAAAAAALEALAFGSASKLAIPLASTPEPFARQGVAVPFWWWAALGEGGRARPCVTAFAGSPSAGDALGVASGDGETWLARLRSLDPSLEPAGPARLAVWDRDPFAGGAYTVLGPGDAARLALLARPLGRVAFAGEHTAGPGRHGTLEGALRSGRRAAGEVAALLGR
jgi:monoamine oxidase